jgi:hypothetical protein
MESSRASQPTSLRSRAGRVRRHPRATRCPRVSPAYGRFGASAVDRMRRGPSASPFPLCVAPTQNERVEPATRRTPVHRECARRACRAPAGHPTVANRLPSSHPRQARAFWRIKPEPRRSSTFFRPPGAIVAVSTAKLGFRPEPSLPYHPSSSLRSSATFTPLLARLTKPPLATGGRSGCQAAPHRRLATPPSPVRPRPATTLARLVVAPATSPGEVRSSPAVNSSRRCGQSAPGMTLQGCGSFQGVFHKRGTST